MQNFIFNSPTKIIFGKGEEDNVAKELKGEKVLIHHSESSVKSGLLDRVKENLNKDKVSYVTLGGVVPNPRLSLVREGSRLVKKEAITIILAIGGGSVIDSAKAIALGGADEEGEDFFDFFTRKRVPTKALPVGVVLTIASAGSESSNSCVIRNEEENLKRGINIDIIRPRFAILNPELTYGVPAFQMSAGICDIYMHTLDRYFTDEKDCHITDGIAESVMKTVLKFGLSAVHEENYEARANIMWAGSLSHNTLTGLGRPFDFTNHAMERGISGFYDTTHAEGLASLWGYYAIYTYKENIMRFAKYAVDVLGIEMNFENPEETALEGIFATIEFFESLDLSTSLKDMGLEADEAKIDEIATFAFAGGATEIGTFFKLNKEDVKNILRSSFEGNL